MLDSVSSQPINKITYPQVQSAQQVQYSNVIPEQQNDNFTYSNQIKQPIAPKIGTFRLMTGFLTDRQVEEINKTGKLPQNAKFVMNGYGGYQISNNFFGVRVGTQTLPEGFEVKKNVIGQAVVLPKGANGLMIR